MVSEMHLAQLNVATLVAPIDSPELAVFVAGLDRINAIAESSPGFVWRLVGEGNDATSLRPFPDPDVIVNLSVWTSRDALRSFMYRTDHASFLRRRREWFRPMDTPAVVLWHVPAGHLPSLDEARERLDALTLNGPSPHAFGLRDEVQ
jgi:hypothetical protein